MLHARAYTCLHMPALCAKAQDCQALTSLLTLHVARGDGTPDALGLARWCLVHHSAHGLQR